MDSEIAIEIVLGQKNQLTGISDALLQELRLFLILQCLPVLKKLITPCNFLLCTLQYLL